MNILSLILVLGVIFLNTGCTYDRAYTIVMTPKEEMLNIEKPFPLAAGLLIAQESRERVYRSPSYPDYRGEPPVYPIEPYRIAVGPALEKAAQQIFSQAFQRVDHLQNLQDSNNRSLVLALNVDDFSLPLFYSVYGTRYIFDELVSGQCTVKITGRLIFNQKTIWQGTVLIPGETRHWVNNYWLRDNVRDLASDTLVLALKQLAGKMVQESQSSPKPLEGWFNKIDQSKTGRL
ncbi:MAG: hypothetical protein C0407_16955 [Desulfobacca sp.]|nr:hypothetical protein [Desulfobacca sp.]